jgi:hypothetical protein
VLELVMLGLLVEQLELAQQVELEQIEILAVAARLFERQECLDPDPLQNHWR